MFVLADAGGFVVTAFFSFVAGTIFVAFLVQRAKNKKPPKLAGATVPQLGEFLDLARYYDITHRGDWGSQLTHVIHDVRIIGYVGDDEDEGTKAYMRGRWLVAAHRDGRKVYLMPNSIVSLTESAGS
jgi:hypothetical protein